MFSKAHGSHLDGGIIRASNPCISHAGISASIIETGLNLKRDRSLWLLAIVIFAFASRQYLL
jgi:hypothetical protein